MRKVCVVVTARASYSRIKSALTAIQDSADLELHLLIGASALLTRFGDTKEHIKKDGFSIEAEVHFILEGETPTTAAKSTGLGIIELATLFSNIQPDVVVSVADRFETIATAIAASYTNIPVAHVQGGEVTGSIDEKVRHAVTKLANLHLVSNQSAADRVIRMGEEPKTVHVTGCPSIDLAAEIAKSPKLDFNPFEKYGGVGAEFDLDSAYVIVMQHPITTEYGRAQKQMTVTLEAISELRIPTLWFWPNVDPGSDEAAKAIRLFREHNPNQDFIRFFRSMSPEDFLRVLVNSRGIIGNSSVAIRESSFLGVPAVNIGSRQHGRERGPNVIDVPHDKNRILAAIQEQFSTGSMTGVPIYGDGYAGQKIAHVLADAELTIEKTIRY